MHSLKRPFGKRRCFMKMCDEDAVDDGGNDDTMHSHDDINFKLRLMYGNSYHKRIACLPSRIVLFWHLFVCCKLFICIINIAVIVAAFVFPSHTFQRLAIDGSVSKEVVGKQRGKHGAVGKSLGSDFHHYS